MNINLEHKLKTIPKKPGVYLWKDSTNDIIYVGKAKNLFNRTHQYFNNPTINNKTNALVSEICDVEHIVTNNENDALVLESNLINKHKPKYNILLKEKNIYPYIVLTDETHPRLIYTRNLKKYKGKYYGPFANSRFGCYEIYRLLDSIYPFRKCNALPKKKCMYYDIGKCLGPCINHIDHEAYDKMIHDINELFSGNNKNILKYLKEKEILASKNKNYELAKEYLDDQNYINQITNNGISHVEIKNEKKIDVIGYYVNSNYLSIIIHSFVNGQLLYAFKQIEEVYTSVNEVIQQFIVQYYLNNSNPPVSVYLNCEIDCELLTQSLNIEFIIPKSGKYLPIINNANNNAKTFFDSDYLTFQNIQSINKIGYESLKDIVKNNLKIIQMFDMSNLYGSYPIGAMIQIKDGKLDKKGYKKFNIKQTDVKGDTNYFAEVITRQYSKVTKATMPNLIIVDGGINQINITNKILSSLNLKTNVLGLVKDDNHHTNNILFNNQTIDIKDNKMLFNYLTNLQNEVHRFAITFYRKKSLELNKK